MEKIYKTEDIVRNVLWNNIESRSDDFVLVYEVYCEINPKIKYINSFGYVMLHHNELGLPSWASITRSRRKVFEKYPDLKPDKMTEIREEREEEFKEYSKT